MSPARSFLRTRIYSTISLSLLLSILLLDTSLNTHPSCLPQLRSPLSPSPSSAIGPRRSSTRYIDRLSIASISANPHRSRNSSRKTASPPTLSFSHSSAKARNDGPPPRPSWRSSRPRPSPAACGTCSCPRTTSTRAPGSRTSSTD